MLNNNPCPYCQGKDVSIDEVIWVSFNEDGEGTTEIRHNCLTCKNEYPVITEFKYEVISQKLP
jgi:hypothetical protein